MMKGAVCCDLRTMVFVLALLWTAGAASAQECNAAAEMTIEFEGEGHEEDLTTPGQMSFMIGGSHWGQGVVIEVPPSHAASGAHSYEIVGPGEVAFLPMPVSCARFFYVHSGGTPPGTATAYNPLGEVVDRVTSKEATAFNDPANYVTLGSESDNIACITFSSGTIDNFEFVPTPPAYEIAGEIHDALGFFANALTIGDVATINEAGANAFDQLDRDWDGLVTSGEVLAVIFDEHGEGEGEGEEEIDYELVLCRVLADLENRYLRMLQALGLDNLDIDQDGMEEIANLALVQAVVCDDSQSSPLQDSTINAFLINSRQVRNDGFASFKGTSDRVAELLAVVLSTSTSTLAAFDEELGFEREDKYEVIACDDSANCIPAEMPSKTVYRAYFGSGKGSFLEVYASYGDVDGDGATNLEELNNVFASGGDLAEFVAAATDPTRIGLMAPKRCGSAIGGAAAGSGGALVMLVTAGAILCARRLRKA